MIFLYAELLSDALRCEVLGRASMLEPLDLSGWRQTKADHGSVLTPDPAGSVKGGLLDASDEDIERLAFYGRPFDLRLAEIAVNGALLKTLLPANDAVLGQGSAPPSVQTDTPTPLHLAAIRDHMSKFGTVSAELAARFYPQSVQRAASMLRAQKCPVPRGLRQGGGEIDIAAQRLPYRGFFDVAEYDLRYPRFDGSYSGVTTRAAFVMADAVTVLPYDPRHDRVMFVEQFRMGAQMRGDPLPWTLEPIAGRIDADEPPEDCARREALEEAGLPLGRLIPVANYYPSAGAVTEYIYSFIGLADLPLTAAGIGGLADEEEDIRAHILPFAEAMAMLDRGEIEIAPLILSLLHLARIRDGLRAEG